MQCVFQTSADKHQALGIMKNTLSHTRHATTSTNPSAHSTQHTAAAAESKSKQQTLTTTTTVLLWSLIATSAAFVCISVTRVSFSPSVGGFSGWRTSSLGESAKVRFRDTNNTSALARAKVFVRVVQIKQHIHTQTKRSGVDLREHKNV